MAIEQVIDIPLSKIQADYDWNSRRGDPAKQGDSGGELEGNEFAGLVESIQARGQDQPVIVRPRGSKGDSFSLVVGFRRFRAIEVLSKGDKTAIIKAIVRTLNDIEAKSLNIRENTARKQLSAADLMKSLVDLRDLYVAAKGAPTKDALANEVGIGRPYASKLFKIYEKVDAKILEQWRSAPASIGVNKLEEIAKLDKGELQDRAYTELLKTAGRGKGGGIKTETPEEKADKESSWMTGALAEAKRVGAMLGNLERLQMIDTENLKFTKHVQHCVKIKENATAEQRRELVNEIQAAYDTALDPPKPTKEVAAKAPEKKATKKPTNGKSVSA